MIIWFLKIHSSKKVSKINSKISKGRPQKRYLAIEKCRMNAIIPKLKNISQ